MQEVQVIRWPMERAKLDAIRQDGIACLLIVAPGAVVPTLKRTCEDWVRAGTDPAEIRARITSLRGKINHKPIVDRDGNLHFRGFLKPLTSTEAVLAKRLAECTFRVVGRQELATGLVATNRSPSRNALDLHIMRLRRKLQTLGLSIETVHGRGYMLSEMKERI
ncbi:helix-turn-helix domain-containing protein [Streptomyces liangshanensis]|uniref:helix-turn-helix domain-containing protein n=1 Tax=Streptomyces liangshanensis TaxID=2717324 RepID=UPI0036DEA976